MLISPNQLNQAVREAIPISTPLATPRGNSKEKAELSRLLENANLSAPEVLEHVSLLMRGAESDGVRMNAAKVALELNGFLAKDDGAGRDFNVTIIINDPEHVGINPILIPR